MGRLEGKVAVITGGASGIGEGTVRLFVDEGARVVIADVQDAKGEMLADTLGGRAVYQRTDVSEEAQVKAAIQRAVDEYGSMDCIYNNAGFIGAVGPIEEIPVDEYDRTMNVLLRGVFLGMKHAAPVMKAQGSGSIISTASIAGIAGGDGPHIYSTAKAAVMHLTKSVALELGESGVRVNCICPGGIATPIFKGAFQGQEVDDTTVVESVKPFLAQFQPIKRSGVADDIARAALFLASDDSTFVNGHALVVDGGHTAGRLWSQQPEFMRTYRPISL
jgi:NAD(P)-dependent dehydrogenase (short-subunit alcohol dehydrogenase family)